MAALCHMSYSYFSRMFKKVVHRSFREYLNYIRISKSELLLATTDLSITDIAMQTGFSTSSYFIQQFKLYKKISPKQFRKKFIALDEEDIQPPLRAGCPSFRPGRARNFRIAAGTIFFKF